MFKKFKLSVIKCDQCNKNNSPISKYCSNCKSVLKGVYHQSIMNVQNSMVVSERISRLAKVHENLGYIQNIISQIPNDILTYVEKQRLLYSVIQEIVTNCQMCVEFLNILAETVIIGEEVINAVINIKNHLVIDNDDNDIDTIQHILHSFVIQLQQQEQQLNYELELELEPVSATSVEELDTIEDIAEKLIPKEDICVICLNDLLDKEKSKVVMLPCGHIYHDRCVRMWLTYRNSCPIGRCKLEKLDEILLIRI
jgi:hypothetical protein